MEVLAVLAENGADLNRPDSFGVTPAFIAAQNGEVEVVKILVENGADLERPDPFGMTPMSITIQNGHVDVFKILVEKEVERGAGENQVASSYSPEKRLFEGFENLGEKRRRLN